MSHFTVLVVGEDVEKQLAPYHEFECTGVDDEYVQDVDITDDVRKELAEGKTLEDALGWFGLEDRTIALGQAPDKAGKHKYGYAIVANGLLVQAIDRTNPNKQWDWWKIGGRWTGYFKMKPGFHGKVGSPGLMTPEAEKGYADSARKGDIDLYAMILEHVQEQLLAWDKYQAVRAGREIPSWDEIRDRHLATKDPKAIDNAWAEFNAHDVIKDFNKDRDWFFVKHQDFACDKDEFVRRATNSAISTFAFVKDGRWVEKGDMGWFGCVSNETDQSEWDAKFNEMLRGLPDDTLLTVVDCHI